MNEKELKELVIKLSKTKQKPKNKKPVQLKGFSRFLRHWKIK